MLSREARFTNLVSVTAYNCDDSKLTPYQEHLRAWLADPQGRDQHVTYRGDEVTVNWHGKPSQCEVAHTRVVRTKRDSEKPVSHDCVELDELVCIVVATRYISCHFTPPGCLFMGRLLVGNETTVRPSADQTHRFLSER